MNPGQIHLALNHLPLFAALFGCVLLAAGLFLEKNDLERAGLWLFVTAGLAAGAAFFSGEQAEEFIEESLGIAASLIEPHEEAAEVSLWVSGLLGGLSLVVLFVPRPLASLARFGRGTALLLSVIALGSIAWTAHLGGRIQHVEIRPPSITSPTIVGSETTDWRPS